MEDQDVYNYLDQDNKHRLRRKLKPLDGMQTIYRHCKCVTLFFSVQTEVLSCSRSYISWKGYKDHIWNNFPNRPIAMVDDITPAKTGRSSSVICWLQLYKVSKKDTKFTFSRPAN